MEDYPLEYYEFFIRFNEGDYYTCHDLLEEMWLTERDNYFLKGLLQMTVALYHYGYGNVKGARLMMETAHRYLQSYRPVHWALDLEKVYLFIETCLQLIPKDIDGVPYEKSKQLPVLPELLLYMEE
jgi:predicted metal-dependent hydrolase